MSFMESLRLDRFTVVAIDTASGRVRIKGDADACTDLSCSGETLVASDDGVGTDLAALNPGDIVKLEGPPGHPRRIVVVRRVWEELTSPEL